MTLRSLLLGGLVLAGAASLPARASAQSPGCTYTFSLGLGGSISGCWAATISELGEDAGFVSDQYFWAGNFTGTSGVNNDPTTAGTFMFNNDCGSAGNGAFAFCNGAYAKPIVPMASALGELVLGLRVPDNTNGAGYNWIYSGSNTRNGNPLPTGYQQVLLQLTLAGIDQSGQFLFGWEDMNSGCTHRLTPNGNRYRMEDLGDGTMLDSALGNCDVFLPGGNGDSDFNDSWMQFDITGVGIPGDTDTVPEPVSMTLMATGMVGLGATARRRKK
ncbi:MAG: PEP-CTERM sorting domain-containing protein [Gemmatimonadetes bacterium]|nr:PEP-CTERM sorting domain-containing protein [Gemmatimonadota bacterium]MBL0178181.1 PEP-CTERM sorting domain-containing protein [Gemmatimonadota bacterium]